MLPDVRRRGSPPLRAALAVLGVACSHSAPGEPPSATEVVARALPSVVLLVNHHCDRPVTYGAGTLIDDHGLVLTNLHVVEGAERLGAWLHEPTRTTFSPLDGGLERFLFEYQGHEIPVHRVRTDPILDLALVRIDADTSAWPTLSIREDPLRPGEPVYALGHPYQAAWSFTAGVVSALPQGHIQHDAAVNIGNSGGPLVDAEGRLAGVNTLKILGDAEGLAFARPIGLARPLLERAGPPVTLDLSDPAVALVSCERSAELAPAVTLDCIDWREFHTLQAQAWAEALALVDPPPEVAATATELLEQGGWTTFLADFQAQVLAFWSAVEPLPPGPAWPLDLSSAWPSSAVREAHVAARGVAGRLKDQLEAGRAAHRAFEVRIRERNGLLVNLIDDPMAYRLARQRGLRVEEVLHPVPDLALVRASGRNPDGSVFGYVECWERREGLWRQHILCIEEDLALLPPTWPLPLSDAAAIRSDEARILARSLAGIPRASPEPACVVEPSTAAPALPLTMGR